MEYNNGVATPLEDSVVLTAFLHDCTIKFDMTGNVLKVDAITATAQYSGYPAEMTHEVHISHTFTSDVNTYSGFGFRHTGTAGAGKSGNRTTIHSISVDYKGVTGEVNADEPNTGPGVSTGDTMGAAVPFMLTLLLLSICSIMYVFVSSKKIVKR